jgi:hypothetical protein
VVELYAPATSPPPGTHWIGGSVGPTAGLDAFREKENTLPLPGFEPKTATP